MSDQRGQSVGNEQPTEQQLIGQRLRNGREALGLTQGDVADVLGVPRTSVGAMEYGRRAVTALELRRLARLYRRSVPWLLGEEEDATVDSALSRAAVGLSDADKEQVLRFAEFLASGGAPPARKSRRARQ